MSTPSLPYHEPSASALLILSSFLILLNIFNHVLDRIIYCGLVGQILLGVAFGTPGVRLIDVDVEAAVVDLGYLGLVLLVFEGGLSTAFRSLRANLFLSIGVALTGISLPIALSYILFRLLPGTTPLQAFAAGAALCSTSLGTTFAVLSASGLVRARIGVVLATAAMMDDVVGLIMVQVISNLGATEQFSAVTVVRPVCVSLGFAIVVPLAAWLVVRPTTGWINRFRETCDTKLEKVLASKEFALVLHTLFLVGMVAGSSYAGTSNLFAAYLAGAAISWWDSELPHPKRRQQSSPKLAVAEGEVTRTQHNDNIMRTAQSPDQKRQVIDDNADTRGTYIFETYYQPALQRILKPFFFASIGFSIPITQMFQGSIVWRGIVYSTLMLLAKLACGVWLVRLPSLSLSFRSPRLKPRRAESNDKNKARTMPEIVDTNKSEEAPLKEHPRKSPKEGIDRDGTQPGDEGSSARAATSTEINKQTTRKNQDTVTHNSRRSNESRKRVRPNHDDSHGPINAMTSGREQDHAQEQDPSSSPSPHKPVSLYPSLIVGSAMVARGEIGFLISSLAQSNGIFSNAANSSPNESGSSPVFLIVTWAIMLCTIVGPLTVGALVRRVKKLERHADGKEKDVLGVWGVD